MGWLGVSGQDTLHVMAFAAPLTCEEWNDRSFFVLAQCNGRRIKVPIQELEPIHSDEATRQAIANWRYWMEHGYGA